MFYPLVLSRPLSIWKWSSEIGSRQLPESGKNLELVLEHLDFSSSIIIDKFDQYLIFATLKFFLKQHNSNSCLIYLNIAKDQMRNV